MPKLLTIRDLCRRFQRIRQALEGGETFLLVDRGRPLAQLCPIPQRLPAAADPVSPVLPETLVVQALTVLDETALSRVLGLTQTGFVLQRSEEGFSGSVRARLSILCAALEEQALFESLARRRKWWNRSHKELKNRSPVGHLALPWTQGDSRSHLVFELIHRQYLIWQAGLSGKRLRHGE